MLCDVISHASDVAYSDCADAQPTCGLSNLFEAFDSHCSYMYNLYHKILELEGALHKNQPSLGGALTGVSN